MSMALKQVFNKDKTFRPKRKFEQGTQRFDLHKKAQASLNAGLDLKQAVLLPHGEGLSDWVAVHAVDFFNRVNLIYGTISESCTDESCPVMSGGPKYEYRWQDEHKYKKPTALPAPKYMSLLMDWIEMQINNEVIFPTNVGTPFPKNFMQVAKKILSRLFRVFVHVYIHHFDRVLQMGAEAHVNTCYKHFYYFVKEFNLIDHKELEPLVSSALQEDRKAVRSPERNDSPDLSLKMDHLPSDCRDTSFGATFHLGDHCGDRKRVYFYMWLFLSKKDICIKIYNLLKVSYFWCN
ncbi:MOB kinase activator 3A isoform X1 [Huso huso]|uniref:MOB kinase activator 3A isoform X1 n=1 Tax=Huso huso TaxID=61971 RepID=A0ABR0Y646_HUSHU